MTLNLILIVALLTIFGYSLEQSWNELNAKSEELHSQGRYLEGIKVAEEVLKVIKKTFGPDHLDVASSLKTLAIHYRAQAKRGAIPASGWLGRAA